MILLTLDPENDTPLTMGRNPRSRRKPSHVLLPLMLILDSTSEAMPNPNHLTNLHSFQPNSPILSFTPSRSFCLQPMYLSVV